VKERGGRKGVSWFFQLLSGKEKGRGGDLEGRGQAIVLEELLKFLFGGEEKRGRGGKEVQGRRGNLSC